MDGCSASDEVSVNSPLRNLGQIPILEPHPPVQNPTGIEEEEDTPSMRELVQEIDSHVELVDLEITNNLNVAPNLAPSQLQDSTTLPTVDIAPTQPDDPAA